MWDRFIDYLPVGQPIAPDATADAMDEAIRRIQVGC